MKRIEQLQQNMKSLKSELSHIMSTRKLFSIKQGVTVFMLFFSFLILLFTILYIKYAQYDSVVVTLASFFITYYFIISKYNSPSYTKVLIGWFCIFMFSLGIVLALLFGWKSGGALFVIILMSFNYFLSINNKLRVIIFALVEILIYVPFFYICFKYAPNGIYAPSREFLAWLFFLVCFSNFSGLMLCMFLYSHIVSNSIKNLESENEDLANRAKYDYLTGLLNRRTLEELIALENLQKRDVNSFALIIGDVDHFKQINDTYSHDCGDLVLKQIAKNLLKTFRVSDKVCRWGGEEFMVFCENVTFEHANILLERTRKNILSQKIIYENEPVQASITFGAVFCDNLSKYNKADLIKQADILLYEGKKKGRNCVVFKRAKL